MKRSETPIDPPPADATIVSGELQPRGSGSRSAPSSADDITRVSDSSLSYAARADSAAPRPAIEGYELLEEVHRGGQGIVYRAHQLGTKRVVALKVLLEGVYASETARRRFEREVELAASLKHPCIVTILDSGLSLGRMYFVMEFIDGLRLDQYLKRHELDIEKTLDLFEEISLAVHFAHQRGVIHRDLKPSNILVDAEGRPHILDFGLAKTLRDPDPEATVQVLSTTGQVVGTLAYMSPEQAAGSDDVDVRTDVYSLGVIFYETLLGRTPYPVSGPLGEVLNRIANDEPARPRGLRPATRLSAKIDDEIETILLKSLEKDATRRYQGAGELARDLRHYRRNEPIEAKRASGLYMFRKTLRKYRWQAGAAGLLLLMLFAFLISFALLYKRESVARGDADRARHAASVKAAELAKALEQTERAEHAESAARKLAEDNERRALRSAESLRRSLTRQKIQRGDLARARGDLADARDSYWDAFCEAPDDDAALWELRRYYLESGDSGATQLSYRTFGPTALSQFGLLALVSDAPNALTLRESASGEMRAFFPTPGPVLACALADDGRVAAAGNGWLRMWLSPDARESVSVPMPDSFEPGSIFLDRGAPLAVVVGENSLRVVRVQNEKVLVSDVALKSASAGPSVYASETRVAAVATSAGIEVIEFDAAGAVVSHEVFAGVGTRPLRSLSLRGDDTLIVVSTAIDALRIVEPGRGATTRLFSPSESWDFADASSDGRAIGLASRDGRVGMVFNGALDFSFRVTEGRLEQFRCVPGSHALITVDARGALTRWRPRSYDESRVMVHDRPAVKWASSADGRAVMLADTEGRIIVRSSERGDKSIPIVLPSFVDTVRGRNPESIGLSIDGSGDNAVVFTDNRIWVKTAARPRTQMFRWNTPATPILADVALSSDGRTVAFHARSENSERQTVQFLATESPRTLGRAQLPPIGPPFDFAGPAPRAMLFIPNSDQLVVARSNGELVMLQPDRSGGARRTNANEPVEVSRDAWATLESPAATLTIDRAGQKIAAACDDGVIRVLSVLDVSELSHAIVGRPVRSISFNADGSILMARSTDGRIAFFEVATGERFAEWSSPQKTPHALSAWFGDDGILLSESDGVFVLNHREADQMIRVSAAYARQRRAFQRLTEGDFTAAWAECESLAKAAPQAARDSQIAIVEQALRRARGDPAESWLQAVECDPSPFAPLRLAHAAYDGNRFELAYRWFAAAAARTEGGLDLVSQRRIAECEYLLGEPARAAERYAAMLKHSPAFSASERSMLVLETIAALVAAEQRPQAAAILSAFDAASMSQERPLVESAATSAIGALLIENQRRFRVEGPRMLIVNTLLADQWVRYRDDIEFFLGENAKRAGELAEARQHFQRCIDLARDSWPSNWARLRLHQLEDPPHSRTIER